MASENYLIRITRLGIDNPVITRTLSVPKTTTFHKFHQALQIVFGWATTHLYKFDVLEPLPANRTRLTYRTTLLRLEEIPEPPIVLACMLQGLIPRPELPMPVESSRVTLEQVLDNPMYVGKSIEYGYDFGDGWEHTIEKIGTERGNRVIKCVAGRGHGVAEDCGGIDGWKDLKFLYSRVWHAEDREEELRTFREDEEEKMTWFEEIYSNGDKMGLDPDEWSMNDVNARLARLL